MPDDKAELPDSAWEAIEAAIDYHATQRQIAALGARLRRLHAPVFQAQVAECCRRNGRPVIGLHGAIRKYDCN